MANTGPALHKLLLCFPLPLSGVLSPPNVYCLVVNTPCGAGMLRADGRVTEGAPWPGRKTFPSHREWSWLPRPLLSVRVPLNQEAAQHERNTMLCKCNFHLKCETRKNYFCFALEADSVDKSFAYVSCKIITQSLGFNISFSPCVSFSALVILHVPSLVSPSYWFFICLLFVCVWVPSSQTPFFMVRVFTSNKTLVAVWPFLCTTMAWKPETTHFWKRFQQCDLLRMQPSHWRRKLV